MPRISMFLGIVIFMYYDDHSPPHFHALYEGTEAVFSLNGVLLRGAFPGRAAKLVQEWATQHRDKLAENWSRAAEQLPLYWIDPLR